MLNFTFLGTSSGAPTKLRNVTGLAVQPAGARDWFLIDAGEGTQHQLQRTGHSLRSLQAICITHVHGDHCYGLPGLLASAGMAGRTAPLTLVAPLPVWTWLASTRECTDLHLPYDVHHVDSALQPVVWQSPGVRITAHPLYHRVACHAFGVEVRHDTVHLDTTALRDTGLPPGPAWKALQSGQDLEFEGAVLKSADFVAHQSRRVRAVFGGDNADPSMLQTACADAQVLVHEATYTQAALDKVGPGPMHSSAKGVATFAQQVGVPNLVLTHFSQRHHDDAGQAELEAEARAQYQGQLWLGRDFDAFELNEQGQLRLQHSDRANAGNEHA
ncbi:ribonuclease Z [Hydrogenophaga sp. A37]|uniref:ribonuclease Z n=1 Tax=Hydrogenophaga sp. A37 TaxID=1945864 RepID=UPI000984948A|nr:ribonuclease Z [Hydrogenophaga sp. A37]OOG88622.1 MBL fold metallo-hydrolase [Hydrogenophaga sp. A37]